MYLYETHCHCAQCSACAISPARELVRAYHRAGYTGLVLTDHFIFGNTAVPRELPWKERMHQYYDAYLEAKAEGDVLDFDVIFGFEHAYGDGKEVLVYGVGLDFLLVNPDIPRLSLEEFVDRIHEAGGIVVQAHPYRERWYVNMSVAPRADLVDGIEVYNAGNRPGEDAKALALAKTGDYILTSGGDVHWEQDAHIGAAGIYLPRRVKNEWEFVQALKEKNHAFRVQYNWIPVIQEEDLP